MAEPSDENTAEPSDDLLDGHPPHAGPESSEPSDEADGETDSTNSRHWLTNDLLAGFLDLAFVATVLAGGAGWLNLQTVPWYYHITFVTIVGTATVWAFGPEALSAWNDAKVTEEGGG